ncbi:MAG: class I SAM-dependent methyltransferase [Elusimicrobiota bacterium]|nr:class I SAM-dependent methyltransferase [Endomicrobiia bacterium]MDW7973210.1 class I SAM-dependent methyltransferase [Thermodesulfovibrio sp.]MDW8166422.1 class I SAM-dependent methyltransferase [Elusimicrobiota bacterium]
MKRLKMRLIFNVLLTLRPALREANKIFTHLTLEEKLVLYKIASKVSDGFAVEIGSYLGASACFIAEGLSENAKLICIDTWRNEGMSEGLRDTYQEFLKNTERYKGKIIPIRGYSWDVVDDVRKITEQISLLFIDGNHSYEAVKKDWLLYSPLLKSGGFAIFHDVGWAEGVKKVVEELVKPISYDHMYLPNMFWCVKL